MPQKAKKKPYVNTFFIMLKNQPTTKPTKQKKPHNFVFPALEYLLKDTT